MKLSTKGRYGLKAMFDLAINHGNGPVSLTIIAERQNISVNYLEQLISPLRKNDLVKSVRGAQGGYLLARDPKEISVGDILKVLEGPLAPTSCVVTDSEECAQAEYCVTRIIWDKMKKSIDEVVDTTTLQDMIDDYERMRKPDQTLQKENCK